MNLCKEDRSVQKVACGQINGLRIRSLVKYNFAFVIAPIFVLSAVANALAGLDKMDSAPVAPMEVGGTSSIVERALVPASASEELGTLLSDQTNRGGVQRNPDGGCSVSTAFPLPECAGAWTVAPKFAGQKSKLQETWGQTRVQIAQAEKVNLASKRPTPKATPKRRTNPTPKPGTTSTPKPTATPDPTATPTATLSGSPTPTATPTPSASGLDTYGGTTAVACTNGAAGHFYTEKLGNRWWLCDPAGNGFFLRGVWYMVPNANDATASAIQSKYAGPLANWEANWALEQARRLQTWGFNTVADYAVAELWPGTTDPAWNNATNTIPVKLPFALTEMTTHYAFINSDGVCGASALKDLMNGTGAVYTGYHYGYGDYFDPNFSTCVGTLLKNDTYGLQRALNSLNSPYLIYVTIDESDETGFLDAGADFTTVDGTNTGVLASGYNAANAAWIALVTAPTQSSNSSQGVTYSDTTVYTKQAFSSWLSQRYSGSIAALNTAWGANYTSFGAAGGWGIGSGLMDENGTCPAKVGAQACWVGEPYALAGETAAMQTDLNAFYVVYLDQYFSVETAQFHAYAPGVMLQAELGSWGAPPPRQVLTEAAKYIDLPIMSATPAWVCLNCIDQQARIDFTAQYLGDRPWINWSGFFALPDSAEAAYATANPAYATQPERGTGYQTMVNNMVSAKTTAYGSYPIVGFDWWDLYDMNSQNANWGLLSPLDNPYDGTSATIGGNGDDQWGYPTGGEQANYGDFLTGVTGANSNIYSAMIATP